MRKEKRIATITAPCRLHISLIDMEGSFSDRVDGGVGIALDSPRAELSASATKSMATEVVVRVPAGTESDELQRAVEKAITTVMSRLDLRGLVEIQIAHALEPHSGLGSKTAHLLAAARAVTSLYGLHLSAPELANLVGRGGTSGIGTAAFANGGFVLDCGHSFTEKGASFRASSYSREMPPAPTVFQQQLPAWPILLATPKGLAIHGAVEQAFFEEVCPVPLADVQKVSHAALMMLVPGVIEADLHSFCRGLNVIRECRWKSFEISSQAPVVREVLALWQELGLLGTGMSSWGSSVFAFDPRLMDPEWTHRVLRTTRELMNRHDGGSVTITRGTNAGHTLLTH
jgi:beta-ribofuranosylaminobenzene 5'-phosphate synthase